MKKALLLCLALCTAPAAYAQQNSAVVANIKSLDGVLNDLSALSKTLEVPIPTQLIPMQLGQLMMSPGMVGIDTAKPINIFLGRQEKPQAGPPRIITRFFVKGDGTEYIESIKRMLPHHEHETDNIHKFPMAGPGASGPAYYVVMKNGKAISGHSLDDIKSLGMDLNAETRALFNSMPGNLSVSVNTDVMKDAIAQQLEAQKKAMEMQKDAMAKQGIDVKQAFGGDPDDMMNSYNSMVQALFVQFETFAVNLDVNSQITIRTHVKAKPETVLQKMITESAPVSGPAASMSEPGSYLTAYGSLAGMDYLLAPYGEWIGELYSSMGPPFDKLAQPYKDMMASMKGIYQGSYNLVMLPPKGDEMFRIAGMYGIKDKAAAKAAQEKMIDLMLKEMSEIEDSPMSISIERLPVDAYKGVDIEQFKLSYGFTTNIPGMSPAAMNMMSNMNYLVAYADDAMFYSMGGEETMHKLIDHFASAGTAAPLRTGFDDINQPLHGYWNINFASMMSAFSAFIPEGTPGMETLSQSLEGINAGLRGAAFTEQGGYTTLLRLTEEDIKGFKKMAGAMKPTPAASPSAPVVP